MGCCMHVGDLEDTLGFRLRVGSRLAIIAILGVGWRMEDLSPSLSVTLTVK